MTDGLRRADFVIDGLGMVHHAENYARIYAMASPAWKRILGPGRPVDAVGALDFVIRDVHQRSHDRALDRWTDDGGAP